MTTFYSYPGPPLKAGLRHRFTAGIRSLKDSRNPMSRSGVRIDGKFRKLGADDLPLIMVAHNERRLIASFLMHYRGLGVTRFLWLDDASTDGSAALLAAQPDVDVLTSNVRYSEARRGRIWREMIVDRYGRNRWYIMVDADEFLIYKNCENAHLSELTRALDRKGNKHLFAPMIDMYPGGMVEKAVYNGDSMPWIVANKFDGGGYRAHMGSRGWQVEGGVRNQLSNSPPLLTKYPLIYWDDRTNLNTSIHFPAPYNRNINSPMGALLHFKFFSDFRESFERIIQNGHHFDGGVYYKTILEGLGASAEIAFKSDRSVEYEGSLQMHELGFFSDWQ